MIHQRKIDGDFTSGLNINKWKNIKKWLHFNDINIHLNGQIQNVQFIWWLCMTSTDILCILFVFSIIFITCHPITVMKSLHEILRSSMHTIIPRGLWAFNAIFVTGPFWMNLFHFVSSNDVHVLAYLCLCRYTPM